MKNDLLSSTEMKSGGVTFSRKELAEGKGIL